MLKPPRLLSKNRFFSAYDIGDYTFGCPEVLDWGDQNTGLSIGRFCSIASDVKILLGGEHRYDWISTYSFPDFVEGVDAVKNDHRISKGGVTIGNDVWIGFGATILSGVSIGNGAVIGAKAVVAKNVPAYSIAVGNPARVIKQRFDDETVARLNQIAWWNWPLAKIKNNAHLIMSDNLKGLIEKE